MKSMKRETHTIDASGKVLGRLATEIAVLLRGKNKPDFVPYKEMGDFVIVKNASQIKVTGKKMDQKTYFRHSGYLGSEQNIPLKVLFQKDPGEVLRIAVYGMLPKNKLRPIQIKRLRFK